MNPVAHLKAAADALLDRFQKWSQSFNPYVPEELARDGIEPVRIEESAIKRQAGKIVLVTFVIFFVWSVTAPLDAGVVVNGTVVVMGSRKAVQHPAGGVVEDILIREGSLVKKGDVLIRINPLNIDADLRQSEYEYINALAGYSRLLAERTEAPRINWDADLNGVGDNPQVTEAKQLQTALFRSRRAEYNDQRSILAEQGEGLSGQLKEKQHILALRRSQLGGLAEETDSMRTLAGDGFVPRSKANEAERHSVEAQAAIAAIHAEIANIKTGLAANQLELSKLKAAFNKDVDTQLTETQKLKETLRARVQSLRFDQSLANLRAPVGGTVVALKAHTIGGVITAGQVLMEIVPEERTLVVDAQVPPYLIDKVHIGMATDLRFSAFNMITTPVVPGVVKLVGADRLPPSPPQYPEEYYLAQVETTAAGYQLLENKVIQAGMPVEVIVKSGERSFMSYLLKPLTDRFARSFKD
jgi:protease secretion system membrane fusion protein